MQSEAETAANLHRAPAGLYEHLDERRLLNLHTQSCMTVGCADGVYVGVRAAGVVPPGVGAAGAARLAAVAGGRRPPGGAVHGRLHHRCHLCTGLFRAPSCLNRPDDCSCCIARESNPVEIPALLSAPRAALLGICCTWCGGPALWRGTATPATPSGTLPARDVASVACSMSRTATTPLPQDDMTAATRW